jgi:hypothetical protein
VAGITDRLLADALEFDLEDGSLTLNTYESMAKFTKEEAREFALVLLEWSIGYPVEISWNERPSEPT